MSVGMLALRVVVGGLFFGHGTQKLKGWFGGSGLEGTEKMMDKLDMYPTRVNAIASGTAEAVGGALLVAGLAVPVAAAGLIGSMVTAVRKVHWKNGPWNSNRGWEYNAVLIAAVAAIVEAGPGKLSLDGARGRIKWGRGWALAALAAGVIGSTIAIERGRQEAEAAKDASEPAAT
jgi:putative oxidoreductase